MTDIGWSMAACHDLEAIRRYVARDNPQAARRVGQRLVRRVLGLRHDRQAGSLSKLFDVRELHCIPYTILFRQSDDRIAICRILPSSFGALDSMDI